MRGQKNDDVTRTDSAGVFADALGGETLLTLSGTRAGQNHNYSCILVYTALYSFCLREKVKDLLLR